MVNNFFVKDTKYFSMILDIYFEKYIFLNPKDNS